MQQNRLLAKHKIIHLSAHQNEHGKAIGHQVNYIYNISNFEQDPKSDAK